MTFDGKGIKICWEGVYWGEFFRGGGDERTFGW